MRPGVHPETILVVEDDAVLGQVLDRILSQDGYAVRHAQSASEVQKALSTVPKGQDALVLVWSNGGNSFRVLHAPEGA